ncbi:hypothetical protein HanXRQr2_Chr11g0470501 [Helianthus annuus]|uniref:Uncharacterized protein n=1 Tax=Helianthus annuus TaxID=4232 RepID=A0A9K3HKR9_HELAN|nr:hypothetical protein HanXRQr2_Chr11g0470501 [Helianthus annuus]KAJ0873544.1 hypothetical protein HanPSC8_Chr11g0453701 [Helianthus annuus]
MAEYLHDDKVWIIVIMVWLTNLEWVRKCNVPSNLRSLGILEQELAGWRA